MRKQSPAASGGSGHEPSAENRASSATAADAGSPLPRLALYVRVWLIFLKKSLPGLVASLILAVLIVVKPVSAWTGEYSFLSFPFLHLFFYPAPATVGAHLETTILGVIGVSIGLGISFLAVAGAVWLDDDTPGSSPYRTPESRAVGAIVLVALTFVGAYISSRAPRLKQATRICLFVAVWVLTTGATVVQASIFLSFLWPAVYAALASLFANVLVFPRTSNQAIARLLIQHVVTLQSIVDRSTQDFFQSAHVHAASAPLQELCRDLLGSLREMRKLFHESTYELSVSRMSTRDWKPLMSNFWRLRGWIACGMGLEWEKQTAQRETDSAPHEAGDVSDKQHCQHFETTIKTLARQIGASLDVVRMTIDLTLGARSEPSGTSSTTALRATLFATLMGAPASQESNGLDRIVLLQRKRLRTAVEQFRDELDSALGRYEAFAEPVAETGQEAAPSTTVSDLFDAEMYAVAFLMVSLLEIANECTSLLVTSQQLLRTWHMHPRRTVHSPAVHWREWFGNGQDQAGDLLAQLETDELLLSKVPSKEQDDELDAFFRHQHHPVRDKEAQLARADLDRDGRKHVWASWTRSRAMLHLRYRLSRALGAAERSRHIKYAIKLASGVALLSLPAWMTGQNGREWFDASRGQWLVISYVWCLETSTAATFTVSAYRMIGTASGAISGVIIWEISRGNPFAIVVLVCIAELCSAFFLLSTTATGIGVVYAVTYSIVVFLPYLDESHHASIVSLAWTRGYQIFLGIAAALLVNTLAWPYHARSKLSEQFSLATMELQTLYLSLSRQLVQGGLEPSAESAREFEQLEQNLQSRFTKGRALVGLISAEISLVPKPFHYYSDILTRLQSISDQLMGLRLCREHGMRSVRREAILNVLDLRRDFISSVLICFWVIGQSLRNHTPLPQFLPSPRAALHDLTAALRAQMLDKDDAATQSSGLAALHRAHLAGRPGSVASFRLHQRERSNTKRPRTLRSAFFFLLAEHALLAEMVEQCEALLELCRALMGEATFMDTSFVPTVTPNHLLTSSSSTMHSIQASILADLERARRPLAGTHAGEIAPRPAHIIPQSASKQADSM
ncbi:hypothetical protein K437DRAFT_276905 [Tilletiaria anomala UBC 951]|uniref:Uncharacterized protein n=1 Tax=Tilletiaria anomala (strain ATCC 24038 / CBS 436.72 / UBC 951) TaxID=1037660 RepID=A0A066VBL9_TILAU|nr:uncharacterized protein K437DRAFT_276905 [Tilletiaria anomala UBC 951]KDN35975.1 hypothetical protein K437DRAFT_276905 [Tilletiaria anomala UBC 951]